MIDDLCDDILGRCLKLLTLREGCRASTVCRRLNRAWAAVRVTGDHQRRLVVSCSFSSKVIEVCPVTLGAIRAASAKPPAHRRRDGTTSSRGSRNRASWSTSMAFAPSWWPNRDLYVCQYKVNAKGSSGVLQLRGTSLSYRRIFYAGPEVQDPEGMVFAKGLMFTCSAVNCQVVSIFPEQKLCQKLDLRGDRVPWAIAMSPPQSQYSALYVTVEKSYPADEYFKGPQDGGIGAVLEVRLTDEGRMLPATVFAAGDGTLLRPSGLCFDGHGSLLVASLDGCIHCFAGPGGAVPGEHLRVLAHVDGSVAPSAGGYVRLGRPWAVAQVNGSVVVLSHSGSNLTQHATNWYTPADSDWQGVALLSTDGSEVSGVSSSKMLMYQPNTMAVE